MVLQSEIFISYDEVAIIYKKILKVKKSEIIDVGTGNGVQIKDLLAVINNRIKIRKKTLPKLNSLFQILIVIIQL